MPLLQPARYKGAHGGRGSGKSHFFADTLIDRCMMETVRAVCIREVQKSLDQSVKQLLEDKIKLHGLGREFRVLEARIETPGGGIVIFNGMQNHTAESIKSLEGYDIAWVEEAQSLSQRSLDLLRPTIRKETSEIWLSWNPRNATDPVDKLLRSADTPPGVCVVEASWRDNPFFPDVLRREMEWDRSRDVEKYNHIWLGGYERHSEARVFKNWRVDTFDTPANAAFLFGGDWGFSVDPTVLIRGYVVGRDLFIDAEAYEVGCEIDHTPALFDRIGGGMARRWVIVTDSARPETISYMKKHGYPRVTGAKKGAGSVEEGIEFLKSFNIIIHSRCTHVIDEFTMYSYKIHPLTGQVMPILSDKKNHTIDSARYMVESLRLPQGPRVLVI